MTKRPFAIVLAFIAAAALGLGVDRHALAQRASSGAGSATAEARDPSAIAPVDLAGYWVSIISDEWAYRMLTPPKGNVDFLPLNNEGRRVANEWDPQKDEAAGEACRAYGAGGVMRLPARLHITWQDTRTLKVEIDAGSQTRLLHFGQSPPAAEG